MQVSRHQAYGRRVRSKIYVKNIVRKIFGHFLMQNVTHFKCFDETFIVNVTECRIFLNLHENAKTGVTIRALIAFSSILAYLGNEHTTI